METVAKDELSLGETYFMNSIPTKHNMSISIRNNVKLNLEGVFKRLDTVIQGGQPVEYAVFTNVNILDDLPTELKCRLAQVKKISGNISVAECNDYNNKENDFYLREKQWNFISKDRELAKAQAQTKLLGILPETIVKEEIMKRVKGGKTKRSSRIAGKRKRKSKRKRHNKKVKKTKRRKSN
jgi:hypothetical protein